MGSEMIEIRQNREKGVIVTYPKMSWEEQKNKIVNMEKKKSFKEMQENNTGKKTENEV